jgi:putative SOS response-associated peptidase YedK
MCGRFTFQPTEAFYERFEISKRLDSLVPRYNIAPGQMVPVIIANSPRQVVLMRWGLVPYWAKDEKTAYKMINARVETLTQGLVFRGLLSHNRCLVPASGFDEWKAEGRAKTPYDFTPRMNSLSRSPASTMCGPSPTMKNSTPSPSSRQTRTSIWPSFTTVCRSC